MIVMNDFKREYSFYKNDTDKAIKKALASGWYILGKEVESFEKEFAKYIGTKYCIGVANGLEALQISLMALGIGKGDEVMTVANTAVATVLAISNTGATPVFVDVDQYFHMDIKDAETKVTKKTKAIVPVHLFGQMVDVDGLKTFAKKHDLFVVEDACQAHGAKFKSKVAGSIGDLGCFSFYPTKNLGAYGDGGAITTNSKKLYEKCMLLRNYGQKNRYVHVEKGLNSRLDELQAAILREKLKHLETSVGLRQEIAKTYYEQLQGVKGILLPKIREGSTHSFHLFVIRTNKRDKLMNYLKNKGIQTIIHYPTPVHKQECYREYKDVSLPVTEACAREILSLPINPFMTKKEVSKVCAEIKDFFK